MNTVREGAQPEHPRAEGPGFVTGGAGRAGSCSHAASDPAPESVRDPQMRTLLERELAGRDGAWVTVTTHLPGARREQVSLESLAEAVARSRALGYFPAGPMFYTPHPSDVRQDVDHSRLAFTLDTPQRRVQAFMIFDRRPGDVRTTTVFRHDGPGLGPRDLLLSDLEALVVDVAGLSLGLAQVIDYEGEVRYLVEVAVPGGGTPCLRSLDPVTGGLRPAPACPTSFEPLLGRIALTGGRPEWGGSLHEAAQALARRFDAPGPQLIPAPDAKPSFAQVLVERVGLRG